MAEPPAVSREPVALAAELRPLLARNAAQAEGDRRLPAENIEAIEDKRLRGVEPVYPRARELCEMRGGALSFRPLYLQWLMRLGCWSSTQLWNRRRASGRSRGCERPSDAPERQLRARWKAG